MWPSLNLDHDKNSREPHQTSSTGVNKFKVNRKIKWENVREELGEDERRRKKKTKQEKVLLWINLSNKFIKRDKRFLGTRGFFFLFHPFSPPLPSSSFSHSSKPPYLIGIIFYGRGRIYMAVTFVSSWYTFENEHKEFLITEFRLLDYY